MSGCNLITPLRRRHIFDELGNFTEDPSIFTVDSLSGDFSQASCFEYSLFCPEFSQELESSTSSRLSEFTPSPEWCQSQPSVHTVTIMSALIDDLQAMSHDLSEIQDGIKSLGLSKISLDMPVTPWFIYTPPTPELDTEQEVVELEDWEIEQRLRDMTADVDLMYLDVVEMAEEGFFPDGIPTYLYPDSLSEASSDVMELPKGRQLEPEDVMRFLRTLAIPEMLEKEDQEEDGSWSDYSLEEDSSSSEAGKQDEDLFEDEKTPTKVAQSWSAQFDSYNSIKSTPTPSDSGEDLDHTTQPKNPTPQGLSIIDETFQQSFHVALSPLSQLIHTHSSGPRRRRPARRIQHSPTISFAPAPSPRPRDSLTTPPSTGNSDSSLFSEPTPLLPFSVPLPPPSPSSRESTSRHSFWNKLKGVKIQNPTVDSSPYTGTVTNASPFKIFSSPGKRSASDSTVGPPINFMYDTTSIRGIGCLPR